ncbi:MAG: hypothetical protein LBL49_07660 [Clostridiales Family XIII bacterium]|nr:hypothetical protein [Clostridiales Family XIII bacterium]
MQDMILNTNILPEPLFKLIHSSQIRVQKTDQGVFLMPIEKNHSLSAIKKARGIYNDGELSVDKFLAEKRAEETGR